MVRQPKDIDSRGLASGRSPYPDSRFAYQPRHAGPASVTLIDRGKVLGQNQPRSEFESRPASHRVQAGSLGWIPEASGTPIAYRESDFASTNERGRRTGLRERQQRNTSPSKVATGETRVVANRREIQESYPPKATSSSPPSHHDHAKQRHSSQRRNVADETESSTTSSSEDNAKSNISRRKADFS